MKTTRCRLALALPVLTFLLAAGCDDPPRPETKGKVPDKPVEGKKTLVGPNVFLEVMGDKRRVLVSAEVCLRRGEYRLEGLLCRKNTKEHEYVLAAEVDARDIHTALVAAGAKPGAPVQFQPKYTPASGDVIKVSVRYEQKGRLITMPAQKWLRTAEGNKECDQDWVFAGSGFVPDPDNKSKPIYLANQGDVICTANMDTAMMDLPIRSSGALESRLFTTNPDVIPEIGTKVVVVLEPAGAAKK
jgi:hypothetical protein